MAMKIILLCHALPDADFKSRLNRDAYLAWRLALAQAPPRLKTLVPAASVGPGGPVLCAPQAAAVASAQRLYPDRRIEVKTHYREPALRVPQWQGWDLRPAWWERLNRLGQAFAEGEASPDFEPAQELRRRVIDSSIRLIEIAKQYDEAVLVAGPGLCRLLGWKLASIGYAGPLLTPPRWGRERVFTYAFGPAPAELAPSEA